LLAAVVAAVQMTVTVAAVALVDIEPQLVL
jgi:hypothetical protein